MCGICGFANLDGEPVDDGAGRRMMELLRHRGPDGDGTLVRSAPGATRRPSVFLGHRRLKIIDLSDAARQPMPNETKTVWVTFNGEIYNFRELRAELRQCGHEFRSASDTETIVHAYEQFGDDFIRHLDGMFAFALWDEPRARLVLARDRSGKKPLYYIADGARFTFAQEIKALLACPWVEPHVAADHIPEYLVFGYVPGPRTMYRGVYQVPPGSYMIVDAAGVSGPRRYWELKFSDRAPAGIRSAAEAARRVRELLTQAVARRMISDVPLGALLSGGLDSSIVVGIMSQLTQEPVRTFTAGFPGDLSYDEQPYAEAAAKKFRTRHTVLVLRGEVGSLVETLLWHHDQPYGDYSAVPTYLVAQLARQHVTVALNGDGGDEVFAGYERFLAAMLAAKIPSAVAPLGRTISRWLPNGDGYYSPRRRLERFFFQAHTSVEERFAGWMSLFDAPTVATLMGPGPEADLAAEHLFGSLRQPDQRLATLPLLQRLLHLNFTTYLPDDLHVKMDRMSMAHGLETRSPMLDTALVEFVASLPPEMKIRRGQLKYILRLAFRDMLPRELLRRRKHGFTAPVDRWFRHELRPYAEETLLARDAHVNDYLRADAIRSLYREHKEERKNNGDRLWALLNLEVWLRMLRRGDLRQRMTRPGQIAVDAVGAQ
ncbi:MAG TPA: asparagine synthase (glutamine-hydrolyzing) [bacterium]|nr:asparagine synthase (glutamine-hydrolyzing) [bacterium]